LILAQVLQLLPGDAPATTENQKLHGFLWHFY
jgi:hypothetical protein